ncbi:MAG: NosD domain-containing protein [Candidatus Bathyarchaeia archaeon]
MSNRLDSGLMLTLLVLSVLTFVPHTLSTKAVPVTIPKQENNPTGSFDVMQAWQGYLTGQNEQPVDLRDIAWTLGGSQAGVMDKYVSSISWGPQESITPQPHFVSTSTWLFKQSTQWRDFAYVNGNSVELVIGINNTGQGNYHELVDRLIESGGGPVDSVLMGENTQAIVADVPLSTLDSFVSEAEKGGLASYIEPNMRYQIDAVPNDPEWSKQWGLRTIEADWAWNTTVGSHSILVAVVDTGIDWQHPDLAANYVALGYNWVNNDPNPMDDNGHGTHCAGVIAATINNSLGIAGLAQVRIMGEKGLDASGIGSSSELAKAIVHAVNQGANIISCSWGSSAESTVLHEAVRYAYEHGVVVVAAAGNDATNVKHYPAAFDEVVAVAATDELDNPASFTNYGDWLKVAAPGVNIYSTVLGGTYAYMSGTSMATPHVSGVAALIWSMFPNMTRDQVWAQLQYTADDLGAPGFDVYYGFGRVNARKAVEQGPSDHDVLVLSLKTPPYLKLGNEAVVNTTILDMGKSNESGITVELLVNGGVVQSQAIDFLVSGASASLSYSWTPTIQGAYNVTCYILPVSGEAIVNNNFLSNQVTVRAPQVIRVPHDYPKIQDAISAAFEGDTISVASGTYYENVWINKEGLTLVGEDRSRTIIDGQRMKDVILVTANYVKISGFTLQNSLYSLDYAGIFVASEGVTITDTTTMNNYHGILLYGAVNATLRNNNMTGNKYNFGVEGYSVTDFIHDVDASNTVNGKSVYYLVNQDSRTAPADAGYVAIVNSSNIIVRDLQLRSNQEGVLFVATVNSYVENVNASDNYYGLRLAFSHNNSVDSNAASNNYIGIYIDESESNNVRDNMLMRNEEGIDLYYSEGHTIDFNKLLNNGLGLYVQKSSRNTINGNEVSNNTAGLLIEESSYSVLKNNSMTANRYNFGVTGSDLSHFIQDVDASNTVEGRPVYYWLNQKDREIPADAGYVSIVNSTNISVRGLNVTNNVQGVLLAYASGCLIENVNALNNTYGIYLYSSNNNTLVRNTVTSEGNRGIELISSNDNSVGDNAVTKNEIGIGLWLSAENNTISGNAVSNGTMGTGLYLDSSARNTISNNAIVNNNQGVYLHNSGSNTLRNNDMTGNSYNFGVYGASLSDYVNDVDTSNAVNGKQVYYLINQRDKQVPANVGYVAVVNSTGISVNDLNLSNNGQGVLFAYTTESTITNVIASDNYNGIYLWGSNSNIVSGSNVANSGWDGIGLYYSERNTIAGNTVTTASVGIDITASPNNSIDSNTILENIVGVISYYATDNIIISNKVSGGTRSLAGIALSGATRNTIRRNKVANNTFLIGAGIYLEWFSNDNTILQNTLSNNYYGISIGYWGLYGLKDQSNNNTIYHNNFKNTQQALSLNSVNIWDDGYPSGGNYWSDYASVDFSSGPYQNEAGSDGIGDTRYIVDANNTDRYPFIQPYVPVLGDLNHDGTVDMYDAIQEASAFGCYPGHPLWNSDADLNQDGIVDIFDIIILAGNFGKTYK